MLGRLAEWRAAIVRVRAAYVRAHRRPPRLLAPRRFTEKVQWRKLFDLDPRYTVLCDKLAVRGYIAGRVGDEHLIPLLWSGMPDELAAAGLTPPYVLKSNHASGQVAMVVDRAVDLAALRSLADGWMSHNHGTAYDELGYTQVPPRLMVEQLVTNTAGDPPEELRMFVFDGRVAVVNTVLTEDGRLRNGAFHTRDWTRLDWHFTRVLPRDFPPPARLADMIGVAERLGAGLDHVRVDFYDCGERFYVGELTLYPWSGHAGFQPDEADFQLGAHWRLRAPLRRAVVAVLFRRRVSAGPKIR